MTKVIFGKVYLWLPFRQKQPPEKILKKDVLQIYQNAQEKTFFQVFF